MFNIASTPSGLIICFIILLATITAVSYLISSVIAYPIIAGNIHMEPSRLKPKRIISIGGWRDDNDKTVNPRNFDYVGHLIGKSLNLFGLVEGITVFCNIINADEIKRDDILILEVVEGKNKGELKGRKCRGIWGNPDEPDVDLIEDFEYTGTVRGFFLGKDNAPQKYKTDPYTDKIEGNLKTLSCGEFGNEVSVSRPHAPDKIKYRIEYPLSC